MEESVAVASTAPQEAQISPDISQVRSSTATSTRRIVKRERRREKINKPGHKFRSEVEQNAAFSSEFASV